MAPKKQTPLFGVGITTPHPGGVDPNLETIDFDALGGLAHLAATASGKPTKRCVLGCYPAQDPDSYSIAVPALRGDTVPEVAAYLHNDLHMDVDLPHAKQVSREAVQALAEAAEDLSALQQQGAALIVQLSSLQEEPAVVARLQASAVADGESLLATRAHILGAQSRAEAEHASALRGAARKALALAAALFSQGDKASKGVEGANQAALQMQRQAAALQEVGAASQAAAEACDRTTAKLQQLTQPTHTHGTTTTKAGSDQGASSGGGGVAQPRDPHTEQALQQQAADLLAVRAELMAGKVGVPEAWAAVHQAVQLLSDLEASA